MISRVQQSVYLQSPFIPAIKQWLTGEMTGHLGNYMYTDDSDDHRWKDGHSAESYYLGRDDLSTFGLVLENLELRVDNLYDLGPGGEAAVYAKSIPLVKTVRARNYYPIDLSPTLSRDALTSVASATDIEGHPVIADFFCPINKKLPNALLAFLGGTLGNIETYNKVDLLQGRIIEIFSNYQRMVTGESYMLVSFDANTNAQEIIDCYANQEFGGLIRSCVERAIDTSNFDYDVTWTPHNYQLATGLRARHDQLIKFDSEEFAIEKGEFLPVLNSYRYPVAFITDAAKKAGWTHQKTWSATGRVHYLLFSSST